MLHSELKHSCFLSDVDSHETYLLRFEKVSEWNLDLVELAS